MTDRVTSPLGQLKAHVTKKSYHVRVHSNDVVNIWWAMCISRF